MDTKPQKRYFCGWCGVFIPDATPEDFEDGIFILCDNCKTERDFLCWENEDDLRYYDSLKDNES